MVYTLPQRGQPNASLGNQLGQGISQGFLSSAQPAIQQQYQRGQLQQALGRLKEQSQNPNATPQDLLYNLIEASSYSPEIGRNLPQLYAELNKAREVNARKNIDFSGEEQQRDFQAGGISRPTRSPTPQIEEALQKNKFFPSNIGAQEAPGNLPQEATGGQVRPILSGDEEIAETNRLINEFARNGVNKTFDEVYPMVHTRNLQNISHGEKVEKERQSRIAAQEKYGALAQERLNKLIPDASDEENAVFKKIGEEAAGQDKSQGDIDRYISREASKYKNDLSNIQKNLEAPRIQNKLQRAIKGQSNDMKVAMEDAKATIKPLLDLGLYEKSRTMLANAGFYPEERETIIFGEMPKHIKRGVDSIPKASFKKSAPQSLSMIPGVPGGKVPEKEYDLKSRIDLFENISNLWGEGENKEMNILQLRKAYEDKGYDWRIFKDAMNELVNNGYIKLTDDQTNSFNSYLNNPPLGKIEQILHGLGLRGR